MVTFDFIIENWLISVKYRLIQLKIESVDEIYIRFGIGPYKDEKSCYPNSKQTTKLNP